jgi:hypothetical protein
MRRADAKVVTPKPAGGKKLASLVVRPRQDGPTEEGWQLVVRKKKRRRRPVKKQGGVPTDLIGLCFNCFQEGHVK